jgi:hypothetical protein
LIHKSSWFLMMMASDTYSIITAGAEWSTYWIEVSRLPQQPSDDLRSLTLH